MSYELIKLSEVQKVESSYNANLLIEEDGQIKRLSAKHLTNTNTQPQVQADWNETDDTLPSYIANKPTKLGAETITYTIDSGNVYLNGVAQTYRNVADAWEQGVQIRIRLQNEGNGDDTLFYDDCSVVNFMFAGWSGYGVLMYVNFNGETQYITVY